MSASEARYLARRVRAADRVLDLGAMPDTERRNQLALTALLVLARDMPAVLQRTLDQAEALTPPAAQLDRIAQ